MKSTRQIFILKGKEHNVLKVMNQVEGFKAVTVLDEATSSEIFYAFAKNKNVVCRGMKSMSELSLQMFPIIIQVTEESCDSYHDFIDVRYNVVRQFIEIATNHRIDIGDHISNANAEGPKKEDCFFCQYMARKVNDERKKLYESENFIVIAGSGAFLDGYLMILPKSHVMSCAELSAEHQKEMRQVISDVKVILKAVYGNEVLIWENGSGASGKGKPKTSIVHAHIHACPFPNNVDVVPIIEGAGVKVVPIEKHELTSYKEESYMLVEDTNGQWYIASDPEAYIPRQFMRQLMAIVLRVKGEDLWDWRQYPFWTNVYKTSDTINEFMKKNIQFLPNSIKDATKKCIY